jgi:hypothetical protein
MFRSWGWGCGKIAIKKIDLEAYREKTENEKRFKNMDIYRSESLRE